MMIYRYQKTKFYRNLQKIVARGSGNNTCIDITVFRFSRRTVYISVLSAYRWALSISKFSDESYPLKLSERNLYMLLCHKGNELIDRTLWVQMIGCPNFDRKLFSNASNYWRYYIAWLEPLCEPTEISKRHAKLWTDI